VLELFLAVLGIAAAWAVARWYHRRASAEMPEWARELKEPATRRDVEEVFRETLLDEPEPHAPEDKRDREGSEGEFEACPRCGSDSLEFEDDVEENVWGVEFEVERCPTCDWSRRVDL
jgi:hypothetical protein